MPKSVNRKIIIITSVYPPDVAGPAMQFARLKNAWEQRGRSVSVMIRPGFFQLLKGIDRQDAVLVHATPKVLLPVAGAKIFKRFRAVARVGGDFFWERAVEDGRFRGTLRDFYARRRFTVKERCMRWLIGACLRKMDAIVFTAALLRDIYVPLFRLDAKKVFAIMHPATLLETAKPESRMGGDDPVKRIRLLYAGRFLKLKNLMMLLEVFAEARKNHPGLTLTLIGDGPEKEKLKMQSVDLKIKDAVEFKEPADHATILEEIALSGLVVLPSLSEVSPNLLMDALAAGTPVLATRENGIRDNLGEAGLWFDPMSKEDFLGKLEATLQPGQLDAMRERMKRSTHRKTWGDAAEEYEKILYM